MGIVFGFFIYLSGFFVKSLWGITILFYLGLAMLPVTEVVLALFLTLGLHWAHRRRRLLWFGRANILVVVLMSAVLNFSVFVLVPVNIDRSISVFLLSWMDEQQNNSATRSELDQAFQDIYIERYRAIDRRIAEQLASGNIEVTPGGLQLTPRGRTTVAALRFFGDLFSTDQRFLHPNHAGEATIGP